MTVGLWSEQSSFISALILGLSLPQSLVYYPSVSLNTASRWICFMFSSLENRCLQVFIYLVTHVSSWDNIFRLSVNLHSWCTLVLVKQIPQLVHKLLLDFSFQSDGNDPWARFTLLCDTEKYYNSILKISENKREQWFQLGNKDKTAMSQLTTLRNFQVAVLKGTQVLDQAELQWL